MIENGLLYVVSTPIGNLEDITLRALRILKEVDLIASEDTRHTRKLLSHYQISTRFTGYYEHENYNDKKVQYLIDVLKSGKNIALVSESGTPGISDPGIKLIKLAVSSGIKIIPVPGATAFVPALIASGFPSDKFIFLGYAKSKKGKLEKLFESIKNENKTIVFYESPHRLLDTLNIMKEILGNRNIGIARELTKVFEEIRRETIEDSIRHFTLEAPRGEFTIIIEGQKE